MDKDIVEFLRERRKELKLQIKENKGLIKKDYEARLDEVEFLLPEIKDIIKSSNHKRRKPFPISSLRKLLERQ
jgi:hypothetical protein